MNNEKQENFSQESPKKNTESAFSEFSRETGIRIELLRRFINRQTRQMRNETWGKLYPSLKELLSESDVAKPRRIGPAYRRHTELVEMVSDQKVLLDVFNVLPAAAQANVVSQWCSKVESTPSAYTSLTDDENKLMGAFLAMPPEEREKELLQLVSRARAFIQNQR